MNRELNERLEEIKEALSDLELKAAKQHLRSYRGTTGPGGIKFGQKVKHKGKDWLVYDFDADSSSPDGFTLVLLASDMSEITRGIVPADAGLKVAKSKHGKRRAR